MSIRRRNIESSKALREKVEKAVEDGCAKARHSAGKVRVSLVPAARILGEAQAFQAGLVKYEAFDWLKGGSWSDYLDAAYRHMLAFQDGEMLDPESGLPHLDHARASLSILQTWVEEDLGTDDRMGVTVIGVPMEEPGQDVPMEEVWPDVPQDECEVSRTLDGRVAFTLPRDDEGASPECPHRVQSRADDAELGPGVPTVRCESCGLWNDGVTITWKAYDEWVAK